jgi:hypothetical protein
MKNVQLRFTDDEEGLLERLRAAAEQNRRSMNAQILWMLERQLTQDEGNADA